MSRSSSSRPSASSDCTRLMLPWTPITRPGCAFSFASASGSGPSISEQLLQPTSRNVRLATNFGTALMNGANGSIVDVGQISFHSSYIPRPSNTVSCSAIVSPTSGSRSANTSSRTNLSGDSTTPSSEMKRIALSFRMTTTVVARDRVVLNENDTWLYGRSNP